MASKLVNGKRVLVGSKADPDSSNYKPRSSSTGTSRTVTLKDGTMLSGQDAADYGSTPTSDILARRTTSSTNLGGSTATGDAVARLRSSMQDSYVSTPTQVADTSTDPASGTDREDDYVPRLYTSESSIAQPQSRERIERDMARSAQKEINSLRDYERTLLDEQATINAREERSTQARNVLSGLAGSSEADMAVSATMEKGSKANERIRAGVEVQVQGILSQIRKDAIAEARAQRGDYTQSLQDEAARLQLANANLTKLAAAGVTFEGLRTTSPREFEHLARQFGGTEALRGAFILSTPQDQILDKKIQGGKYIISKQNPLNGKVTVEVLDIPGLPADYSQSVDLGDRIMFFDPSDPQGKQFFMSKGLTPSQSSSASTPTGSPVDASSQIDFLLDAARKAESLAGQSGQGSFTRTFGDLVGGSQYRQLEAYTNTLRSNMLTLATDPNIKKFFGPQMSNADVLLMTSAGTTLNPQSLSPSQMRDEINRITDLLTRMKNAVPEGATIGTGSTGGVLTSPDGTQQVNVSDLTSAELQEARSAGWQ